MARKRFTTEQIIGLLREAEDRLGQGQAIGTICQGLNISEQSYYRWRRDYGDLKWDQARRCKKTPSHLAMSKDAMKAKDTAGCVKRMEAAHRVMGF